MTRQERLGGWSVLAAAIGFWIWVMISFIVDAAGPHSLGDRIILVLFLVACTVGINLAARAAGWTK